MSWENLKCPRCGSKSVTPHVEVLPAEGEADRYAPVRDEGFRCGNCGLVESCLNNTDATKRSAHVGTRPRQPLAIAISKS